MSLMSEFSYALADMDISDQTRAAYVSDIKKFLNDVGTINIDPDNADKLATEWIEGQRALFAEGTMRRRLAAIRLFCRTMLDTEVLVIDPADTKRKRAATVEAEGWDMWQRVGLPMLVSPDKNTGWRDHSACAKAPHKSIDFFSGYSKDAAKEICSSVCTVRAQCLDFALRNKIDYGVWGGLDPDERKLATAVS